jgi:hypothetical protein
MMRFIHSFIIIAHCTALLQGMDYSTCERTNETATADTKELVRVAELVKNSRRFTLITKNISGLISAIYPLNKDTLGIVESDTSEALFSTLHVFNTQKNVWNARRLKANERRLAEFCFNIESADMDRTHQKKLIAFLKEYRVWKSMVQPVSTQSGNKIFVDTDNTIVIIDPKEPKMVSAFPLPPTIAACKEMRLFPTQNVYVVVATNTTDSGTVHVFSRYGAHLFYEPTDDCMEKPQKVIMDTHNTIVVGRTNDVRVYRCDPYTTDGHMLQTTPLHIFKGSLLDWYDNKVFVLHDYHLKIAYNGNEPDQLDHEGIETPWALNVGGGFFCTRTTFDTTATVLSPYLRYIQKIKGIANVIPHCCGEHSRTCSCQVVDDVIPVLHGAIIKSVLSPTGHTMFAVDGGTIVVLKPEPLKLEDNPQTLEEYNFLTQESEKEYTLFKRIKGKSCYLSLGDVNDYARIPERLRKNLEKTMPIKSIFNLHRLIPYTQNEKKFLFEQHDLFTHDNASRLFGQIIEGHHSLFLSDLTSFSCIPEHIRKSIIESRVIHSPLGIHEMTLSSDEQNFLNYKRATEYKLFKRLTGNNVQPCLFSFDLPFWSRIPERFRNKLGTIPIDHPLNISTVTDLTKEEWDFVEAPVCGYGNESPFDRYSWAFKSRTNYNTYKSTSSFLSVPERFRNALESEYPQIKYDQPSHNGPCVVS